MQVLHHRKISVFIITICSAIANAQTIPEKRTIVIHEAQEKVKNKRGEIKYRVALDPFFVANFEDVAKKEGYRHSDVKKAKFGDPSLEIPSVRYAADIISKKIGRKPNKVTSWIATEFEIDATPEEIKKLQASESGITEIFEAEGKQVENFVYAQTAPGDVYSGAEIIPWYKGFTNTNDAATFTSDFSKPPAYILDAPLVAPISSDLVIGSNHQNESADYPMLYNYPNAWEFWHSAHVDGVFGAKNNNSVTRGINPGYPIIHLGGMATLASIRDRVNYAFAHAELSYYWSALNISMNTRAESNDFSSGVGTPGVNFWEFSTELGRAMAIASNRLLILQAAGNNNSSDSQCRWAYSFGTTTPEWDGIMAIGGVDSSGNRATDHLNAVFNNTGNQYTIPGSNYGPCVELWAPSKFITSIRHNTNLTQVLSGTSFAAPIATAVALRYGDTTTRPIEREWFLKKNALTTAYGYKSAKWTISPVAQIKRHAIMSAWSPQNNKNIANVYNGNYSDMWNSNGNIGSIVIDLGSIKNIKFIRITPRSSVTLSDVAALVYSFAPASNSTGAESGTYQEGSVPKHGDRAPITIPLATDINTRYLKFNGHNYGSWFALAEIEVFGL